MPALPNLRYQSYNLDSSDNTTINPRLNFSGSQSATVNNTGSSYDLAHDDIVLYYQLLNKWIDLDMGVDLKRFDGQVSQAGADNNVEINETIPLLHLSARVALPINGLYLGAGINTHIIDVGLSKSSAQDSTLMMGYDTGTGLGIAGGFKSFSLELNDSAAANTNLEYDGLFLNGYFNF